MCATPNAKSEGACADTAALKLWYRAVVGAGEEAAHPSNVPVRSDAASETSEEWGYLLPVRVVKNEGKSKRNVNEFGFRALRPHDILRLLAPKKRGLVAQDDERAWTTSDLVTLSDPDNVGRVEGCQRT